jgi:1-deoxyxylulose-5-phosphate synthase
MQFIQFGRTGLTVSGLILGTGTFGKQTGEAEGAVGRSECGVSQG